MNFRAFVISAFFALSAVVALVGRLSATDESDDLVETIVTLVSDKDKDLRALGFQQVRESAKGSKATLQFAALLPKLSSDAQPGLLDALADRGDKAARPAVLELLRSQDKSVRDAALRALGSIGEAADVPLLVQSMAASPAPEKSSAALSSLVHLPGQAIDSAIANAMKESTPNTSAELIRILAMRRAVGTVPNLLSAALDSHAMVRKAAMDALGQLAAPKDVPGMLHAVLKAETGAERDAAEKAVLMVCNHIADPSKRAEPVLAGWSKFSDEEKTALLPTLGRVGNADALKIVEAAIADKNSLRSDAGYRAICNWPDATVAPRLLELFQSASNPERQTLLLRALTRVAVLHDKRTNAQRLDLLKTCMSLATHDDERNYVIKLRRVDSDGRVAAISAPVFGEAAACPGDVCQHRRAGASSRTALAERSRVRQGP